MACVTTPMVVDRPIARPRAAGLGRKLCRAIAASTAVLRSALTRAVPLMMRDTVAIETRASRAIISSVGGESALAFLFLAGVAVFFIVGRAWAVARHRQC